MLAVASALGGLVRDPMALLALRAVEGLGFLLAATAGPSLIRRLADKLDPPSPAGGGGPKPVK